METSYIYPVKLTDVSNTDWKFAGIYKITNTINGKCYIGQAIDIRSRLMQHANQVHGKKNVLYKAFDKYGKDNFEARILIITNIIGKNNKEIKQELNYHECFYIDLYNSYKSGYNMTPGGDSGRLGFKHSAETIQKIKDAHKNYIPKRARDVQKPTFCYDLLTQCTIEAESIAEMSHKTAVDYRSISQICNNKSYKNGGRFICAKRYLFSFDKSDLIDRLNWYLSEDYKNSVHKRRSLHWEQMRNKNGGLQQKNSIF